MESDNENYIKTQELPMRKVYLEGMLGQKFGEEWNLSVGSPAEAISAIMVQRPGFRQYLAQGENVLGYDVIIGDDYIQDYNELTINDPGQSQSYTFVPIVAGSKSSGLMMVLGVVLIAATGGLGAAAAAPFMGASTAVGAGATAGALGTYTAATGTAAAITAGTATAATFTASTLGGALSYLGMGLLLGGAAMMLAPDVPDSDGAENAENYLFSGPVNTVKQGEPIPLVYGRAIVGSKTIMGSLFTTTSREKINKSRKLVGIGGFREDGAKHGGAQGGAGRYGGDYGGYAGGGRREGNNPYYDMH